MTEEFITDFVKLEKVIERETGNLSRGNNNALTFDFFALSAPPITSIFTLAEIAELERIATSIKLAARIETKYALIDNIMTSKGFYRIHCGTNRVVYNHILDNRFVAKIAVDSVGMKGVKEFNNQWYLQPFCTRIFDAAGNGAIAFVERVHPIEKLADAEKLAYHLWLIMRYVVIGKFVVDDLGIDKFMNFGVRENFGIVLVDFPEVYLLDPDKLVCTECGGEIDYDEYFSHLNCTVCGVEYSARDLGTPLPPFVPGIRLFNKEERGMKPDQVIHRAKIVNPDGTTIKETKPKFKNIVPKGTVIGLYNDEFIGKMDRYKNTDGTYSIPTNMIKVVNNNLTDEFSQMGHPDGRYMHDIDIYQQGYANGIPEDKIDECLEVHTIYDEHGRLLYQRKPSRDEEIVDRLTRILMKGEYANHVQQNFDDSDN